MVVIIYEIETACGAKARHQVIAKNDEELTEYVRRLVKAQYEVIKLETIK